MPRILYWNIKNFTNKRINGTKYEDVSDSDDYDALPPGRQVGDAIVDTLTRPTDAAGTAVELDFIVIVEVKATGGNPPEGALVRGEGKNGCLTFLSQLRRRVPGRAAWMLVPPVVVGEKGKREAVAVFYRSDRWHFLGPESRFNTCGELGMPTLPVGTIPMNAPLRPGEQFDKGTGQYKFELRPGWPAIFPTQADRKPWLTVFCDANDPARVIRLFAVHTSPNWGWQATESIAAVTAVWQDAPIAANQADVVLGDFNVENTDPEMFRKHGPFNEFLKLGYQALIRPPDDLSPEYYSYYHTHGLPAGFGREKSGLAEIVDATRGSLQWQGPYPGRAYSGRSIDNVLVRYRGGWDAPPNPHTTILSRVEAVPYMEPPGPLMNPPMEGYFRAPELMELSVQQMYDAGVYHDNWTITDPNMVFREWINYGRLSHVSDHFPIMCDI